MKIINLIKSEFTKNYSIKKLVIISFVMLMVSIGVVEIYALWNTRGSIYQDNIDSRIEELKRKENRTLEEEYNLKIYELDKKIYDYLVSLQVSLGDYQEYLGSEISDSYSQNLSIRILQENREDPSVEQACHSNQTYFDSHFAGTINHLCDAYLESELDNLYEENQRKIKEYGNLLRENKYYKYLEYELEKGLVPPWELDMTNFIIQNKVEDYYHYLSRNLIQYRQIYVDSDDLPDSLEEFTKKGSEYYNGIKNYSDYVRYDTFLRKEASRYQDIIYYSSKHSIPHDLPLYDEIDVYREYRYTTAKSSVNLIFHYSVIVMILVSITSSGIVAKEHSMGTIKNIITAPVRRWKILLSKFIYLILHTYIIWLIGLFFLSLYSGIKYGFNDLFTPKLLYSSGRVIEVNYYLYLLKELFIASIPVICFLSILFFLSTITLNTSLTVGVTTILAIISPILWYFCDSLKIKTLVYIPFLFFDTGFIHGRLQPFVSMLKWVDISYVVGIFSSVVVTIILYVVTNIIYSRRDVKN